MTQQAALQAAAVQHQLAVQQQAIIAAALRTNGVTAANLAQRQASLQAALDRTNALLAAQQGNPTLYVMQLQQQNPMVIALRQRQLALEVALQQTAALKTIAHQQAATTSLRSQ